MSDLEQTKYDVNEIVEDPRSARARKEALITQIFLLSITLLIFVVSYLVGSSNPANIKYIFGWPNWYVYGVTIIVFAVLFGFYFCIKIFKCHSLEATADDKEVD